jgi:hypothetical protein
LIEASVDGLVTVDETMKITDVNETVQNGWKKAKPVNKFFVSGIF